MLAAQIAHVPSINWLARPKRSLRLRRCNSKRSCGVMSEKSMSYSFPAEPSKSFPCWSTEARSNWLKRSLWTSCSWSISIVSSAAASVVLGSQAGTLAAIASSAWPAAQRVSHALLRRWTTTYITSVSMQRLSLVSTEDALTLDSRLYSSPGCCFWISPNCWAAVRLTAVVEPVSNSNTNRSSLNMPHECVMRWHVLCECHFTL